MSNYRETLDAVVCDEVRKEASWRNTAEIFTNITVFGKLELNEMKTLKATTDDSTIDYLMSLFDSLDAQYKLIERLDELIDFKKIFGSFFGGLVEKVDRMFIRAIIKYIIFPLVASFFSREKLTVDIAK